LSNWRSGVGQCHPAWGKCTSSTCWRSRENENFHNGLLFLKVLFGKLFGKVCFGASFVQDCADSKRLVFRKVLCGWLETAWKLLRNYGSPNKSLVDFIRRITYDALYDAADMYICSMYILKGLSALSR
jgi:hypothetical protein